VIGNAQERVYARSVLKSELGPLDDYYYNFTEVSHLIKKSIYLEYIMFSIRKNFAVLRGFFAVLREIPAWPDGQGCYAKVHKELAKLRQVGFIKKWKLQNFEIE